MRGSANSASEGPKEQKPMNSWCQLSGGALRESDGARIPFGRRTCRLLLACSRGSKRKGLNVVGIGQMQEVFDLANPLDGVGAAYVKFTGGVIQADPAESISSHPFKTSLADGLTQRGRRSVLDLD